MSGKHGPGRAHTAHGAGEKKQEVRTELQRSQGQENGEGAKFTVKKRTGYAYSDSPAEIPREEKERATGTGQHTWGEGLGGMEDPNCGNPDGRSLGNSGAP